MNYLKLYAGWYARCFLLNWRDKYYVDGHAEINKDKYGVMTQAAVYAWDSALFEALGNAPLRGVWTQDNSYILNHGTPFQVTFKRIYDVP